MASEPLAEGRWLIWLSPDHTWKEETGNSEYDLVFEVCTASARPNKAYITVGAPCETAECRRKSAGTTTSPVTNKGIVQISITIL